MRINKVVPATPENAPKSNIIHFLYYPLSLELVEKQNQRIIL